MPRYSLARMVEASHRFGLQVEVVPGAADRGSSAFNSYGFVGHHTAGARTGDRPSLNLVVNGRADLDGPLSNDFLTRAGVDVIVACGRANHAGLGGFRGLVGNSAVWGTEAEDDGDGIWTAAQLDAYPRLVAARLWLIGRDASWYCAHRTWAPTRKIDPKGISDDWMRARVAALLARGSAPATSTSTTKPQEEYVPLTATDGQTVWNTPVEVPAAQRKAFNQPAYSAEQMLFGANYWAGQTFQLLQRTAAQDAARDAAMTAAIKAVAAGKPVDLVAIQAAAKAGAAQALAELPPLTDPTPGV